MMMEKDQELLSERARRFGDMVKPQQQKKTGFIEMIHQMVRSSYTVPSSVNTPFLYIHASTL